MCLYFNSSKILDPPQVLGCIQTSVEPDSYSAWVSSNNNKKCGICKCHLFPLNNEKDLDCPICHPNANFSENTFQLPQKSLPNNHYFFIFDISMPQNLLIRYLLALHDSIGDTETVSIVCIANNAIFASITNNLLIFDIYDNPNSVLSVKHYTIERKQIPIVVLPSISSIYALTPAELDKSSNPFFGLRCALKASGKRPTTFMLFFYRPICELQVSDAETLGESIAESNSIVHFGGPPEFRRFSAVSRYSFGCVFGTDNLIYPKVVSHLVQMSRHADKIRFIAPRCVSFAKTTGCAGSVNTTEKTVKLRLNSMVGGSIQFKVDGYRNNVIRLLEIVRTKNGTFLTIHSLSQNGASGINGAEVNHGVTDTILLKGFASDVLRSAWDGEDFKTAVKEKLSNEVRLSMEGTCLADIGNNMQLDILRLYYILLNYGKCNLIAHLTEKDDCDVIVAPPIIYINKKKDSFNAVSAFEQNIWPFTIKMMNSDEFQKIRKNLIID